MAPNTTELKVSGGAIPLKSDFAFRHRNKKNPW